jgi:hypothetical protein
MPIAPTTASRRSLSFNLTSIIHCCMKTVIVYKASAGLPIREPSIVSLFLIVQRVHQRAVKENQISLRYSPVRPWTMARNSPTPEGLQSQCRSSRTPAHMNLAKGQLKKIWLQSSRSPQSSQFPFEGPIHLATCSQHRSLPRIICHRKILILRGTLVRQTSLKWVTAAPCDGRK